MNITHTQSSDQLALPNSKVMTGLTNQCVRYLLEHTCAVEYCRTGFNCVINDTQTRLDSGTIILVIFAIENIF